jgi:hypothetical protein
LILELENLAYYHQYIKIPPGSLVDDMIELKAWDASSALRNMIVEPHLLLFTRPPRDG